MRVSEQAKKRKKRKKRQRKKQVRNMREGGRTLTEGEVEAKAVLDGDGNCK